ncbi:baseplate hub protein [Photorhabdus sp. RM323S]|uniref:baseplate hub protein n=1 Tax=Photorhabdus sp. RM323S TaxID=3342828 RepID=UPI0036D91611
MSQNWLRHFELMLLDDHGKGIVLSDFRVIFNIEWFTISFPRVATLKIYNLSKDTSNRILGSEFSKIKIIVGYDGITPTVPESEVGKARPVEPGTTGQRDGQNYGEIFSGDIRFTLTGRDNPTDTYTQIQACDGQEAFAYATINQTVAAGYTVADINDLTMKTFSPYGITEGHTPEMPTTVYPRGRVLFGMSRDIMDNVAKQCKATWQFVDGKREMVSDEMYVHDAIVLNSRTGLIGMPQQTIGAGVNVRCLINPNIKVNGLIKLDEGSVYRTSLPNADIQMSGGRLTDENDNGNLYVSGVSKPPASIATDGVYIVKGIMYTGDTRGNEWYQEMMCEARGATDLPSRSALDRGL